MNQHILYNFITVILHKWEGIWLRKLHIQTLSLIQITMIFLYCVNTSLLACSIYKGKVPFVMLCTYPFTALGWEYLWADIICFCNWGLAKSDQRSCRFPRSMTGQTAILCQNLFHFLQLLLLISHLELEVNEGLYSVNHLSMTDG